MNRLTCFTGRLRDDCRAVTALEYGLIAGVIVVVALGGFGLIGDKLGTVFTEVGTTLDAD